MLGQKFTSYYKAFENIPSNLYDVFVELEISGLIDFDIILNYMGPEPGDHALTIETCESLLSTLLSKIEYIILDQNNEENENSIKSKEELQQYSDITIVEIENLLKNQFKRENQIFCMAAAYLRRIKFHEYDIQNKGFSLIFTYLNEVLTICEKSQKMQNFVRMTPLFNTDYRNALILTIDNLIDPLYMTMFPTTVHKTDPFVEECVHPYFFSLNIVKNGLILELLNLIGFGIYEDTRVFLKVTWILLHDIYFFGTDIEYFKKYHKIPNLSTEGIILNCLLPGLCRTEVPNELSNQINRIIQHCPYDIQICLFEQYMNFVEENIYIKGISMSHQTASRRLLKLFTNKPIEV